MQAPWRSGSNFPLLPWDFVTPWDYDPELMGETVKTELVRLGASEVRGWVEMYRDTLRIHQEELNRLNVYPVPDGDTGTNMLLTLESVVAELSDTTGMAEVCHGLAHGSLMGARGNSGIIVSQILRGFADTFSPLEEIGPTQFSAALRKSADAAYQAVMRPVEGTILTVVRETAEATEIALADNPAISMAEITEIADGAAALSLARTPELLPQLKQAGVVDSGGRGFTLLISALRKIVDGTEIPEPELVETLAVIEAHAHGDDVSALRYEVMYLLDAPDTKLPAFKETWASIGDSIVVVGGDGLWNCHIHTDEIGPAIEAGIEAGRPNKIRVTDLLEEAEEERLARELAQGTNTGGAKSVGGDPAITVHGTDPVTTAVVAVAVGEGLQRLLASIGVHVIVAGGQSMNPSTGQIAEAVEACPADSVVVLPNNKNIIAVAKQVDTVSKKHVVVVPTISVVEALSALVEYDPNADAETNAQAMGEAAARVKTGEVTQAVRDSECDAGPIAEGDWIALDRKGIQVIAPSVLDAAIGLVDFLVDEDAELVTVILGSDARHSDRSKIEEHLAVTYPGIETEFHDGGQPLYPFLLGVE